MNHESWIFHCNKLRSTHLRMVTSSLVSKELLSVAEACCFFKDSSSAWDTKKMILVYYHQTTFGRVPGRNLLPADKSWRLYYSGLLSFWHRHQDKQIYPLHTISPLTYFLFHNVLIFLPLTRFYSICLIVVFFPSDLALVCKIIPHFHLHTNFPPSLTASARLSVHPHSQSSQDR